MNNILNFAQARATSRAELTNGWLTGGTLKIYSGTRPATPDTAISGQVLLATFTFPDPAGTVENGVWTKGAIEQAMVAVSGTAAWARIFDSTGTVIADCDVGATGSGAVIEVSNISLVEGGYVIIVSFTLTEN
jgi:hypothetical protein